MVNSPLNSCKQNALLPQPHSTCLNEVIRHASGPATQPVISHIPLVKNNPSICRSRNVNNLNAYDNTITKTVSFKTPLKDDVTEITEKISHVNLDKKSTPLSERPPTPPPIKLSKTSIDRQSSETSEKKNNVSIIPI